MILQLRQRHRRVFAVIGVLLPVAFAVGLASRKPVPNVAALPAELAAGRSQFTATVWERDDLFAKVSIRVRLLRDTMGKGAVAVSLSAPRDFLKPDLIVYWVAGAPKTRDNLPDDARLLGSFSATALPLPADVARGDGSLILFSLADQEIVEMSKPLRFDASTK